MVWGISLFFLEITEDSNNSIYDITKMQIFNTPLHKSSAKYKQCIEEKFSKHKQDKLVKKIFLNTFK